MAYMSQEKKAKIAPAVKAICKKYGVKASLAVHNHSSLVLNVKSGPIDFIDNFIKTDGKHSYAKHMDEKQIASLRKSQCLDVNPFWFHDHFSGKAKKFLGEVLEAMNNGNHDNSDIQTDYFDVGWYVNVNIGKWNKPYTVQA